ncbi:MAG: nucleotidyltransferase domain-containing protein [Clostridiales bacterium]|nr:nucleotidyltransferase domain-containing protein [Clostridiales bacterium]
MISVCNDFEGLFNRHAAKMRDICRGIYALPDVSKVVLFGSYAKRCAEPESDVDIAVFFECTDARLLRRYRQLTRICANPEIDVQAQPFHTYELSTPCGIIEEIEAYGLELRPE